MIELNIIKVGLTAVIEGETVIICDGDLPLDCVVVFMDKESWEKLKQEMPSITRIRE